MSKQKIFVENQKPIDPRQGEAVQHTTNETINNSIDSVNNSTNQQQYYYELKSKKTKTVADKKREKASKQRD